LPPDKQKELAAHVAAVKPDFFWVGLSTPKQERWMAEFCGKLDTGIMIGVGAAFDIHTGSVKDSPEWVKQSGLQWLHRLIQEPRRLWKRYLINNPMFLWKIALQFAGLSKYTIPPQSVTFPSRRSPNRQRSNVESHEEEMSVRY